nr:MAG TPA: hypothetical protein [Caudoviricetes sp.]
MTLETFTTRRPEAGKVRRRSRGQTNSSRRMSAM